MMTDVFEKHFIQGMKNKDFETFQKAYPTLFKVILKAMNEVSSKNPVRDIGGLTQFLTYVEDNFTWVNEDEYMRIVEDDNADTCSREEIVKGYLETL